MAICYKKPLFLLAIIFLPMINADESTTAIVTECHYQNKTYKIEEQIITEHSCSYCKCDETWTGVINYDKCAIIDCPFYNDPARPHCAYNYVKDECCPVPTCGPWHPDYDDDFITKNKRPKLSMDGVNLTMSEDMEMTLFCIDRSGNATNNTLVTWQYKTLSQIEMAVNLTTKYVGVTGTKREKELGEKREKELGEKRHSWGLYFENTKLKDSGQYTCTIHTTPTQLETSFVFILPKRTRNIKEFCFEKQAEASCLYPADSHSYYNETQQYCVYEDVKTCAPTGNRFANSQECTKHCNFHSCHGENGSGPCNNQFIRYFYDSETDICQPFMYGGCKEDENSFFNTLEDCMSVCEKIAFEDGTPKLVPEEPKCEPCPWYLWVHYLHQGCYPIWADGACCPIYFECNKKINEFDSPPNPGVSECDWNNHTYNINEEITIPEVCQVCQCRIHFQGPGSEGCKPKKCQPESTTILQDTSCVPIYTETECCPTEHFCPPSIDFAQKPPARLHPETPELHCRFGKMSYPRGFQYQVSDPCLVCHCLTPPYFTCERIKCNYHTLDYCPWNSNKCCCSDEDMSLNYPRPPILPMEIEACEKTECSLNSTCQVNATLDAQSPHQTSCKPCPKLDNCTLTGRPSRERPYHCPNCIDPITPEEACEWRNCTQGSNWCSVYYRPTSRRKFFEAVCESDEDRKKNGFERYFIPLCNTKCSLPCNFLDSVDNTCPICHCP